MKTLASFLFFVLATLCLAQTPCNSNNDCPSPCTEFIQENRVSAIIGTCLADKTCSSVTVDCQGPAGATCSRAACDNVEGCSVILVDFPDLWCPGTNDECLEAICAPVTGECATAPVDCTDGDACTIDTCNSIDGCQHTPVNCTDNNPCTAETCDSSSGCVYSPATCTECTYGYCYWSKTENHQSCEKVLTEGIFPTKFCGKDETTILQEETTGLYANSLLAKQYFVSLNNMNCRNNEYNDRHLEYMLEAAVLLQQTCEELIEPSNPLFGKMVSITARLLQYMRVSECKPLNIYSCEKQQWKSNGKPEFSGYQGELNSMFLEAGYTLNGEGYYVLDESEGSNSGSGWAVAIPVVGIALVALAAFGGALHIYRRQKRIQFVDAGGSSI